MTNLFLRMTLMRLFGKTKRLRKRQRPLAPLRLRNTFKSDKIPWADQIAKYLDGESLANLAMTSRCFKQEMRDDTVWKLACLRDLKVNDPLVPMTFTWRQLYASVFRRKQPIFLEEGEKFIGLRKIGAFVFESPVAFLTCKLILPEGIAQEETTEISQEESMKMWQSSGSCKLNRIKTGIWIVDLIRIKEKKGDEQVISEARHIELSLIKAYLDGKWQYKVLGTHNIEEHADAGSDGIFDFKHIRDPSTSEVFDLKSWAGEANNFNVTTSCKRLHGVATNSYLPPNNGYRTEIRVMRDRRANVVAIRSVSKFNPMHPPIGWN